MSSLYHDDDGEDTPFSPPFLAHRGHKVPPFDRSDARADDQRLCMAACAALGCVSITSGQARKWAEIEERRRKYADYAARAKAKRKGEGLQVRRKKA